MTDMTEVHLGTEQSAPPIRRVTIEDVARDANVSVSAVSKVIRDASGVSPQMKRKVSTSIDRLGYRPHAGARGMRGRSFTIGVVLVQMSAPFQVELATGVGTELEQGPYQDVIIAAGLTRERQRRSIEALVDRQVDGLILIGPALDHTELESIGTRTQMVVIARHGGADHFDTVVDDDHAGAGLVVDHLVSLGHERIMHISHSSGGLQRPHVPSHIARRDGYEAAMKRYALTPDVIVPGFTEEGGYQAALEALDRRYAPTAIFAGADIAALGVLRAAEERGLRIPDELSVAGYDNILTSQLHRVSLTTVDQSGADTGAIAARLLLDRINGRTEAVHHVIVPRLIERGTTAQAPAVRT